MTKKSRLTRLLFSLSLFLVAAFLQSQSLRAQDYVTGSFEGEVRDSVSGAPLAGVTVRITNQETGVPVAKQTDSAGRFRQGLLPPGDYSISISKQGYVTQVLQRSLPALRPTVVLPPVPLVKESAPATATASPSPEGNVATATPTPATSPSPGQTTPPGTTNPPVQTQPTSTSLSAGIREDINTTDARRGGTFSARRASESARPRSAAVAARATPCAWLPADAATTPCARSSAESRAIRT